MPLDAGGCASVDRTKQHVASGLCRDVLVSCPSRPVSRGSGRARDSVDRKVRERGRARGYVDREVRDNGRSRVSYII